MKSLLALTLGALCFTSVYVSLTINTLFNTYLEYFTYRLAAAYQTLLRGEWTRFRLDCTGNMEWVSTSSKANYYLVTQSIQIQILLTQMRERLLTIGMVLKPIMVSLSIHMSLIHLLLEPLLVHSSTIVLMESASTL
jgi:hypothetical protein